MAYHLNHNPLSSYSNISLPSKVRKPYDFHFPEDIQYKCAGQSICSLSTTMLYSYQAEILEEIVHHRVTKSSLSGMRSCVERPYPLLLLGQSPATELIRLGDTQKADDRMQLMSPYVCLVPLWKR